MTGRTQRSEARESIARYATGSSELAEQSRFVAQVTEATTLFRLQQPVARMARPASARFASYGGFQSAEAPEREGGSGMRDNRSRITP